MSPWRWNPCNPCCGEGEPPCGDCTFTGEEQFLVTLAIDATDPALPDSCEAICDLIGDFVLTWSGGCKWFYIHRCDAGSGPFDPATDWYIELTLNSPQAQLIILYPEKYTIPGFHNPWFLTFKTPVGATAEICDGVTMPIATNPILSARYESGATVLPCPNLLSTVTVALLEP